jgi:putative hydrolase of the HAD superfamily
MAPRLIIFDMDDVLCQYDFSKRLRVLSQLSGKSPRDIRAAIWDSGFEDDADSGLYATPEEYLDGFGLRLGYPLTREEWITARRAAMNPNMNVIGLAASVAKNHGAVIYTNNGPLLKEAFREVFPEAHAVFKDRCFCSCEFGTKKPDLESYRRLIDRLGVPASDCWFIDDKHSNVEGARRAGLAASLFTGHAQLQADAIELGVMLTPHG